MDALMRIVMWKYAALVILSLLFVPSALAATHKNVLILHEGSRLLTYQFRLSREMQKDLASKQFDIQIFEEYVDSWHLTQDPEYALDVLEAKYAGVKFDVVVVDGNAPFQAMLNRPPAFLQGAPVVFLTVPDYDLPSRLPPNITGVTVHKDYGAAVHLAQRLQPGLRHLYYVEGGLPANALRDASLRSELAPFRNQVDIVSLQGLDVDYLLKRVKSLPPHSAILFDSYLKDPAGKAYVPTDVADLIAKSANAPVYALFDTTVGGGELGGVVIGFDAIGKQAAEIVLGLLSGAPVWRYPVEHSHNQIMIDWSAFQRFGLSESLVPSSAVILNRPPTAWEKYREYLIAAGVVILLQTALIIELGLAGKLRKRSERTARELARRLINAQEEERRRLAGELHDDVSQRLALIAVHLDMMRNSPPASRDDLVRELSVLYDETDLISSDIHQFSHELHPTILERLGLASALRRYCAEFSAHRKIAVQMSTTGEEPLLNQATALAFFRIGQECLMNAAKHSGAADCKVSLTYARDRITLTVEDNGGGFDATSTQAETGLGIQSMRERLRSIDGTLRIRSSPLHGTKVIAEARFGPVAVPEAPEIMEEKISDTQSATTALSGR
jgi:signal transduction histidine kinase